MNFLPYVSRASSIGAGLAALFIMVALSGCGTPGAPQAPSLKLPRPVEDLSAARSASTVILHWTTPQKTADRLLIRGLVTVTICRKEGTESCQPAGKITLTPGALGDFQETLPRDLLIGHPRPLTYYVELSNPKGRSAGLSNPAIVLAGAAPGPILDLTAQLRPEGVALHWKPSEQTSVRLHRHLLTQGPVTKKPRESLTTPPAESVDRDLFVESAASGSLDNTTRFGQTYLYTAQRIERISIAGKTLELAGEISPSIRVEVVDTFPPAIPQGLAAILVPEEKTIDLSWQPDTEADLAGYIVYRTLDNEGQWQRISGELPLPSPAFRDASVAPGHSYRYAVTAIDQSGHESSRSEAASESVPNP